MLNAQICLSQVNPISHSFKLNISYNNRCDVSSLSKLEYNSRRKAENGGGYLTSRCAGGRGNTTHTPEAGEVKLQSPDSLGKMFSQS